MQTPAAKSLRSREGIVDRAVCSPDPDPGPAVAAQFFAFVCPHTGSYDS